MKTIGKIIHNKDFPLRILDSKGHPLYYEYLMGYWRIYVYDDNGKEIYYENSEGGTIDRRP